MLRINKRRLPALLLDFRNRMQRQCRLPGRFRTIDLNNPPLRVAAPQRQIQRQGTRRQQLHVNLLCLPQFHNGAVPKLLRNLRNRQLQRLFLPVFCPRRPRSCSCGLFCHICTFLFLYYIISY